MTTTPVTLMAQNLSHGGTRLPDGTPDPHRLDRLLQVIGRVAPDVLCLQETWPLLDHNRQGLARVEKSLGLRTIAVGQGRSATGTLLLLSDRIGWSQVEDRYQPASWTGMSIAVLDIPGMAAPLAAASVHLTPFSAVGAENDAAYLINRLHRYGGYGVGAGDFNYPALTDRYPAGPDRHTPGPEDVPPYNRATRWKTTPDGALAINHDIAHLFSRSGMVDVAAHMADLTGDTSLLRPTGKGGFRVDGFQVTGPLAPAITSYRAIGHDHSDHAGVVMTFDPILVDATAPVVWK
ncbi:MULTISPECIES: endonuclease/exonuclease/phosphatase family protein [unclassified Nocardiopsis]|uniref:endonuclease/exonuclease/phosphatase family protein n=1 Tax=unclassified Nocardiopsis TaxID=2649073 RepID=UPI00135C3AA7|nr:MULTISPECIES: endonuclease/exonuclease/phosphatase family protein [unclassified Nocardiopsis]